MSTLRMRITGNEIARDRIVASIEGIDGIARIEEIDDLLPHLDDEDSSSAGLIENEIATVYAVEVVSDDGKSAEMARTAAELEARAAGAVLEFVERF